MTPAAARASTTAMQDPTKRRKVTVYLLPTLIEEIARAAQHHDRSASWIVRRAWKLARGEISRLASRGRPSGEPEASAAGARRSVEVDLYFVMARAGGGPDQMLPAGSGPAGCTFRRSGSMERS